MRTIDFIREVSHAAVGQWPFILAELSIGVPDSPRKHAACPACGGNDRFRFDDDGRGAHFCNTCGAGDGLELVKKVNRCTATQAAQLVAEVLGMDYRASDTDPETASQRQAQREAERREQQQAQQQRTEEETAKRRAAFVQKYAQLDNQAVTGESPYLASKGLGRAFPVLPDGSLLLTLEDKHGGAVAAQVIKPDGTKRLLAGSAKKGAYHVVNTLPGGVETVIIAEGLATALSVHLMRPDALTVCAVDANNLLPVAQVMREFYADAKIIIAADNDIKPGESNTGKREAEKAAKAVSGWVALPPSEEKADWNDIHQQQGLETATTAFNASLYQPQGKTMKPQLKAIDGSKKTRRSGGINLIQMADNEKALLLASRYEGIAIHAESEVLYLYREGVWEKSAPLELSREMVAIYNEHQTNFSKRSVSNVIEALKIVVPVMGVPRSDLIPFANGVYDMATGEFSPHRADNWLTNHNGVEYTPPMPGENLSDHAPNFHKWLSHAADNDGLKMQRITAGLFMVLANRHDWQLFLEVTGKGGSGKSVFTHIATMLAGTHNAASGNMAALDTARGRAQFVGKSMITLPDQPKYAGEGTGIKAITGGDPVEIDPKHEHQYTAVLRAVVIATNNNPMNFTERAEGVARRRVIFQFNNRISEKEKDGSLPEKIAAEIPVIVRRLLENFSDPEKARQLLLEQRNSEEALEVKQKTDPLYAFCAHLEKLAECTGMLVGNRRPPFYPRIYVYHAYLSFLEANGYDKPLTLNKFTEGMESAMREFNHEYLREKKTRGMVTNVELSDSAEDWLPQPHPKVSK